jgi:MFS family permease
VPSDVYSGQADAPAARLRLSEASGRWVLTATVLGSSLAMLDATIVNVALPRIGREFGASLAGLQWTVNAYTLTRCAASRRTSACWSRRAPCRASAVPC